MPEGVEIEYYRRSSETALDREIASVQADDAWFLKEGTTAETVHGALIGQAFTEARRIGKLLVLDLSNGERLGLRFGMTGRLIVDESASIEYLEYSSKKNDPKWDRFIVNFTDGGDMRIRDPRRLGGVILAPDEGRLGADAFTITAEQLRDRVLVGHVALKARLLDQKRVAGIGNLIVDELLWRSGLDPAQPAGQVTDADAARLLDTLDQVLTDFLRDGGSHTGHLQESRIRGGQCPTDGHELERRTIGGRTTYSCPLHQQISG